METCHERPAKRSFAESKQFSCLTAVNTVFENNDGNIPVANLYL